MIDCKFISEQEKIILMNNFSYDEARAVHDNDQYELESERFLRQQIPNWDDDDNDLLNHNLPDSMSAPQVCLTLIYKYFFSTKVIFSGWNNRIILDLH